MMSDLLLVCVFDIGKCTPCIDKGMNTKSYFSQYESPNIVIIPNMSPSNPPSPKRRKIGNNILVPIVDNATCDKIKFIQEQGKTQYPNAGDDKKVNKNLNSPKNPTKKASWASNYLQSIGLDSKSSIWQHKIPRKNASKRCVSENTHGTVTSNVTPNLTCSTNTEPEKSGQLKKIETIIVNTLQDKSIQENKNNIETRKAKKQNNTEKKISTENTKSQNEDVNTVAQKYKRRFENNPVASTFSSTNKNKNNITLTKKLKTDSTLKDNLIKRPKDDFAGCTSLVEKHSFSKKSEKVVKPQKPNHPNLIHKNRDLNSVDKSNRPIKIKSSCQDDEITDSLKNTKQNEKYMKRSKPSTSYSSDNLKMKHKTLCSNGHVTSVKSVVKVTKKYDINDINKLKTSKRNYNTNEPTNSAACSQITLREGTKQDLSKKKLDSKPGNIKNKKVIKSQIKKLSQKTKKYRKIKLVINVVCNNKPISAPCNSNDINKGASCATQNVDLDFLNDFDVDEIVKSLDICDRETKLESELSLSKKNSNIISNMFPGAYDNDALDLIKILKGEEDDDLIKQSLEGTTELFSSSNIRTCIANCMLDNTQSNVKGDEDMPIKIKKEKQEITIAAVGTDFHDITVYEAQTNHENKSIYAKNTPTLNVCVDTITRSNDEVDKINEHIINNDTLNAETKPETCNEIIEDNKNETISVEFNDNIATYKKETVKYTVNAPNIAENPDSRTQHFGSEEINFAGECDNVKEVNFRNSEVETTDALVRQFDNSDNENQKKTDIPNKEIEQGDIGSTNVVAGNEDKTTVISEKPKVDSEPKTTAKKSTEVKHDKDNDSQSNIKTSCPEMNQIIPEQIENINKLKKSSGVLKKSASNVDIEQWLISPGKQDRETHKVPKNVNDEEKSVEKGINKDFNNRNKSKLNNDCLSETATSLNDEKINKKDPLSSPLVKSNYIKPNMRVDIARKLEQRMFSYLATKYSIITKIHQGKFSRIFKCKHPSGKLYALKYLHAKNTMNMQKKQMLYSLQNGRSKNDLFTIYLVSAFNFGNKWYILMDYFPNNLDQVLNEVDKPFCIETVQEYARQLVTAVMVLKSHKMVHSDIKPQHILINSFNNTLKLCGFDDLSYVNQITPLPCIGTASYRAPELILGYSAGFEIDVWSTGLVLYEMAVKQKLLPGVFNNDILFKQICTLGTVPSEMIKKSRFAFKHFCGTLFMRRFGVKGQRISIFNNIVRNNKLRKSIYDAYYHNWSHQRNMAEQDCDMKKLGHFITLLEKMLVMHPRYRISIEYVFENTFIYDAYKYEEW